MIIVNMTVCVQLAVKLVRTGAPLLTGTAVRAPPVFPESTKTRPARPHARLARWERILLQTWGHACPAPPIQIRRLQAQRLLSAPATSVLPDQMGAHALSVLTENTRTCRGAELARIAVRACTLTLQVAPRARCVP